MQNCNCSTLNSPPFSFGVRTRQRSLKNTAALALCVLGAAHLHAEDAVKPAIETETSTAAANTEVSDEVETEADLVGTTEATTPPETALVSDNPSSIYDKIWNYTKWYRNDENKVIQKVDFLGRFQVDYAYVGAQEGHYNAWNVRRFRLGARAQFFHDWIVLVEAGLDPLEGQTYQTLTKSYIAWTPSRNYEFAIGKQSTGFTMDGQTSSKRLLTLERNNLSNNIWFTEDQAPGLSITGEPGQWVYQAGIYSSSVSSSEFGNISGGAFVLGTIGYDFNESLGVKEALLRFNYVYNAPENADSGSLFANRPLEQIASLNFSVDVGKWGVRADLGGALGYQDAGDLWGAMIMPYYNISDHFQVVTRYTFVNSPDEGTVRLNRYENQVVNGRGDSYQEWYVGLNWYLYGQKLKFQTGVDYAHMQDNFGGANTYNGWGWTTGFRIYW